VEERDHRVSIGRDEGDQGRGSDDPRGAGGPPSGLHIPARRPPKGRSTDEHVRSPVQQHERPIGQSVERQVVEAPVPRVVQALVVQSCVDRVGAGRTIRAFSPDLEESVVVLSAAQRAGPVPRGEGRGLVEEEQLGESPRPHQRRPVPPPELQATRDPAFRCGEPSDPSCGVVQTSAVAIDEPACGIGDEFAERRDPVLPRHELTLGRGYGVVDSPTRRFGMGYGRAIVVDDLSSAELGRSSSAIYDGEIDLRVLYEDPESGAEHYLIRYPPGLRTRLHRHTHAHTIVVLEGRLAVNDDVIGPGGYCHFPAGEPMRHAPAEGGPCLFVIMFDGPVDAETLEE
jgi:quercetin dioxygenase-like cupin family protein